MPLTKRAVSPVDVSRSRIPDGVYREELQCVANGTLANLIRQLSSLSKFSYVFVLVPLVVKRKLCMHL